MSTLVWGLGNYYKQKEKSIKRDTISAFVSSKETGKYNGIEIISPSKLLQYQFEILYIMAGTKATFEIINELKSLGYKEWKKIVLGWSLEPYIEDEIMLFEDGEIYCNSIGRLIYTSKEQREEVNNEIEWNRLKKKIVRSKKKNNLPNISCAPISRIFGMERGLPTDRYYIERFLKDNASCIKGTALEVAGREYTVKYGVNVEKSYIMHVCNSVGENSIIANLETGDGVIEGMADCFILTQTLPFIFDVKTAAKNVVKFLKGGGVALVTVSGITQISRYDMERWGHFWSFTTASLKKLFEMCEEVEAVNVTSYGNVKSAIYGLYGLTAEELDEADLAYQDEDYQQIITAVVRKKCF